MNRLRNLSRRTKIITGALAVAFMVIVGASGSGQPAANRSPVAPSSTITHEQQTETKPVAFETQYKNSATLPQGQQQTAQAGQNGVETIVWDVTKQNGTEVSRSKHSDTVTTAAVAEVIEKGTYVAPAPAAPPAAGLSNNTTYTNSSGNTVHSPAYSTNGSVPAGATARCNDGTYSFSQHHSGTCSSHGGVAQFLD